MPTIELRMWHKQRGWSHLHATSSHLFSVLFLQSAVHGLVIYMQCLHADALHDIVSLQMYIAKMAKMILTQCVEDTPLHDESPWNEYCPPNGGRDPFAKLHAFCRCERIEHFHQ